MKHRVIIVLFYHQSYKLYASVFVLRWKVYTFVRHIGYEFDTFSKLMTKTSWEYSNKSKMQWNSEMTLFMFYILSLIESSITLFFTYSLNIPQWNWRIQNWVCYVDSNTFSCNRNHNMYPQQHIILNKNSIQKPII